MWIKILKYGLKAAIALGLDKKIKKWVASKLDNAEIKAADKAEAVYDRIDEIRNKYGLWEEEKDADDSP